jgi:hypothetical protein
VGKVISPPQFCDIKNLVIFFQMLPNLVEFTLEQYQIFIFDLRMGRIKLG